MKKEKAGTDTWCIRHAPEGSSKQTLFDLKFIDYSDLFSSLSNIT
jgi:hypothetical protein